jgi:hypothetical protein
MKKTKSTKPQSDKKDQEDPKGKEIQKEKEKQKSKKAQESDSEEDYYTEEEMKLLDKFHKLTNHNFIDDEIYDVMMNLNNDEELIMNELNERLKVLKRGEEYGWTEIGKSNSIIFNII